MQKELWKIPSDWFARWFNTPAYHLLYGHRNQTEADAFVDRLVDALWPDGLEAPLLELACGAGRHAIRFAQRGLQVEGIDLAGNSIELARAAGEEQGLSPDQIHFSTGDMRNPDDVARRGPFGAATLLFTSFGYFASDTEHDATIANVFHALKPGATFVLDFLNLSRVEATLVHTETIHRSGQVFNVARRIEGGWIEKSIAFDLGNGPEHHFERVRAFSREDLVGLVTRNGFILSQICGDYNLGPWSEESPRCILICNKP
jgi:SAM-dependent methyltransferase